MSRFTPVLIRLFISAVFIFAGFGKLMDFAGTKGMIEGMGLPMAGALAVLAIVFELGGGLVLLSGFKTRIAAAMLIVFTVVATVLVHRDISAQLNLIMALKNLAIIGGLMTFLVCAKCEGGVCCETDHE